MYKTFTKEMDNLFLKWHQFGINDIFDKYSLVFINFIFIAYP